MNKLAVFNLVFPNQYLMTATLMRFQEHYESPKYRGKTFGVEEFMDWYAASKGGDFSYFEDWTGFNFPGHILDAFAELGAKETLVRDLLTEQAEKYQHERFYVLGTTRGDEALPHEMAHALFHLTPGYAADVKRLCRTHAKRLRPLLRWLQKVGYHSKVFDDETNAYLLTGLPDDLKGKRFPSAAFRKLFTEHFGFNVKKLSDSAWVKRRIHSIDMAHKLRRVRYL
jgi:hypothetical protein